MAAPPNNLAVAEGDGAVTEPGRKMVCNASNPIHGGRWGKCWVVQQGSVDLFAVTIDGEGQEGARFPLFRVEVGDVIVGIDDAQGPSTCDERVTLLLSGSRECEVREHELNQFIGIDTTQANEAILNWVKRLEHHLFTGRQLNETEDVAAFPDALEKVQSLQMIEGLQAINASVTSRMLALIRDRDLTTRDRINRRAVAERDIETASLRRASNILADQPGATDPVVNVSDPVARAFGQVALSLDVPDLQLESNAIRGKPDKRIRTLARMNDLRLRKVLLRDAWYIHDNGPLIAFLNATGEPVALLRESTGHYRQMNTTTGESTRLDEVTAAKLSGEAFALYRTAQDELLRLGDLLKLSLRNVHRESLLIFIMGLLAALLATATPLITGYLVDEVIPRAEIGRLGEATLALFVIALGAAAFQLVQGINVLRLESRIDHVLQSVLFNRLVTLPTGFFGAYAVGDLADRCLSVQKIRTILSGNTLQALLLGIFSTVSFVLLFFINWQLAIIATIFVFLIGALVGLLTFLQRRTQAHIVRNQGALDGLTVQMVTAIGKLRIAVAERRAFSRWLMKLVDQKQRERKVQRWANWIETLNAMIPVMASATLFVAASVVLENMADQAGLDALLPRSGDDLDESPDVLSTADFLSFNAAFGQFLAGFLGISLALSGMVEIGPLLERVKPILEAAPDGATGHNDPGTLSGAMEARNLSFRYANNGPPIIDRLDLSIESGEFVAITGSSGSGKSSLIRLLIGFETPGSGAVLFDGKSLADLDMKAVRAQIGVVLQNGRINPGSIGSNIIGATGASIEDAWGAAALAGLDKDVKAMPMGMHTVLVDGAQTLSVGQRQRLLLARALVQKPRVLILDEATSALDNRTQAIVVENLQRLKTTRVVIAHRLSTIIEADRILVMDQGRIVQSGAYDDLINQPGLFRELATRQLT